MANNAGIDMQALLKGHNYFLRHQMRVLDMALGEVVDHAILFAVATNKVKFRTGEMSRGWSKSPVALTSLGLVIRFYNPVKHAFYQELGTGIWGPTGRPIVPKRCPYLHFKTADGHWVRTKSVKGVPPKFIGKHSLFEAVRGDGIQIVTRHLERISTRF